MNLFRIFMMLVIVSFGLVAAFTPCQATSVAIPDTVLSDTSVFKYNYGPGSITSRTDVAGPGVEFVFSGLTGSGSAFSDGFALDSRIGGTGSHNGDFSAFSDYTMYLYNKSAYVLSVALVMNTGFTGISGTPPNDGTNDTFWQSAWIDLQPNTSTAITLSFASAIAYNIIDNKEPHTGGGLSWPNGGSYAINASDLKEVSNIGFQVADFAGGHAGVGTIIVGSSPVPLPGALVLLGAGLVRLAAYSRRKKTLA